MKSQDVSIFKYPLRSVAPLFKPWLCSIFNTHGFSSNCPHWKDREGEISHLGNICSIPGTVLMVPYSGNFEAPAMVWTEEAGRARFKSWPPDLALGESLNHCKFMFFPVNRSDRFRVAAGINRGDLWHTLSVIIMRNLPVGGNVPFLFPPTHGFQSCHWWLPWHHIQSFLFCLPFEETVNQKERTMPLRAKEKMRNAKNLALLSSWVFFLLDRAADRPFSNTEANYLPGVKENVSFGCSGFSQCNKSPPWDPSFIWFNKDFKGKKVSLLLSRTIGHWCLFHLGS